MTAQVTVTSPVAVSIAPTSATIPVGQTQQFQATVTNSSDTTVTWSVDGIAGGNAQLGTITASGVYTAPSSTSSHTVAATSNADSSATATAQVTTTAALAISPAAVSGTARAELALPETAPVEQNSGSPPAAPTEARTPRRSPRNQRADACGVRWW